MELIIFILSLAACLSGLSEVNYSWRNCIITSAKIFIDVEEPIDIQKSVILEEITQSIGLMNDRIKNLK